MTLRDVLVSLENVKNDARDCEEDMWHEENAILEGVFRDIADEMESAIGEIESILDKLESCEGEISSLID